LAKVNERFGMLRATDRRAARHRTLEATVGWSYDLLAEPEQHLLTDCPSSWVRSTLPRPSVSAAAEEIETVDIVDLLDRLVDKSLVSATASRGAMRFRPPGDRPGVRGAPARCCG
jgi:predicted ATPase